ncbi:MAG TPA: hypothetical protein VN089_06340, partial [Duganella sp.]|nr:hypothetical protein [Duganella sp.]
MTSNVTVELIENSMRGGSPRKFVNQTVRVQHQAPTRVQGADGATSIGNHPATVEWVGGVADDFAGVTDVRIIDSAGSVVIEAALCNHFYAPRAVADGVIFQVLKDE